MDWSTSFDSARWSKVNSDMGTAILRGVDIEHAEKLHRLDAGKYYIVQGENDLSALSGVASSQCKSVDWTTSDFRKGGAANCPEGWYLAGFYRDGSKSDDMDGFEQISHAWCCKLAGLAEGWGTCADMKVSIGDWTECP